MIPSLNALLLCAAALVVTSGFTIPRSCAHWRRRTSNTRVQSVFHFHGPCLLQGLFMLDNKELPDGVLELVDDAQFSEKERDPKLSNQAAPKPATSIQATVPPFASQGQVAEDALNPDLSDPKQARVIIYLIISLLPVLFLIPLMLASRDLIPPDALPPVEL